MELNVTNEEFPDQKDQIVSIILGLEKSEEPVAFRGGLSVMDKNGWFGLLLNDTGLISDRRHYGSSNQLEKANWWEISYQPDRETEMYAFSKTRQPFHTDNSWFADPAPMNFFAMEKQAPEGGAQTLYRLSRLIDDLKKDAPELLNDLCSMPVVIKRGDDDLQHNTTIICMDHDPAIYWNFYRTQKHQPAIRAMCDAFFDYLEEKQMSPSVETLDSRTGDCFAFNDVKVLHGREAFKASRYGERVLFQSMWHFK